jgi:phosphonopyruvate decarboxylase
MATVGGCPLVFIQNSGLANALNPLMTLTHPAVHSVPLVLLVGLRGWPGDEPQHQVTGRSTQTMLQAAEIPSRTCDSDLGSVRLALRVSRREALALKSPVAVLVAHSTDSQPKNTGSGGRSTQSWTSGEAVRVVLDCAPVGAVVVSSTGFNTRYVHAYRTAHPGRFDEYVYCVGSMGHAGSVAQGIARARPAARVICLDGDGGALMHMGSMLMAGWPALRNYVHVIVNNGSHESVGGGDTLAREFSFATTVDADRWVTGSFQGPLSSVEELTSLLVTEGPVLVELLARPTFGPPPPRPGPPFARLRRSSNGIGDRREP